MAEEFDTPQSRNEAILQNILGAENPLGLPQSRIEDLLMQILEQGGGGTNVVANPEMAGTEDELVGLQVDETKYKVGGTNVVANPEIVGTESDLSSIQIDETKYKVGSGLYMHLILFHAGAQASSGYVMYLTLFTKTATPFTTETFPALFSYGEYISVTGDKQEYNQANGIISGIRYAGNSQFHVSFYDTVNMTYSAYMNKTLKISSDTVIQL